MRVSFHKWGRPLPTGALPLGGNYSITTVRYQMTETQQITEKDNSALSQVLALLSTDQIRFVVARQEHNTDKDAALSIGMRPGLVYAWRRDGAPIDEAVRLMALDGLVVAQHIRRRNLAKAMMVKVSGLDLQDDERLRQSVASEIIEWELGKAKQGIEHSGDVQLTHVHDLTDDQLAAIAARGS